MLESLSIHTRLDSSVSFSYFLCLKDLVWLLHLRTVHNKRDFQKMKNLIEKLNCGVDGDAIERAHRIGPITENEEGKNFNSL